MNADSGKTELPPYTPEIEKTTLNILVVDDDPDTLSLIEKYIRVSRVAPQISLIETASNGQQAWDKVRENRGKFNILITDGKMPVKNGLQLAEKIKESEEDIIVGLVSSGIDGYDFNSHDVRESVKEQYGIAAVLLKPINRQQISEFMDKIRDIREAKNSAALQSQTP